MNSHSHNHSRHINPDHFLETPDGRLYTPERSALAWRQAYAALDRALASAPAGSTLFLVIGVQGGGKTAWVQRHAAALGDTAYFFDAALPGAAHRRQALETAARHGVPVVAVWLDTALELALARNRARREDHRVPEAAIRSVHARFEAPQASEGFLRIEVLREAPNKACPVLVRQCGELQVLAFHHPLAGLQLVKGTLEAGECPAAGALRELREESGIAGARVLAELGSWDSGFAGQVWSFQLCQATQALPERWTHRAEDDGGHDFAFFWQPLAQAPGPSWHPLFQNALAWLRQRSAQLAALVEAARTAPRQG
ncbi:AAA domain-containing protein [Pseudomonas delhiensis]|uniref:AAA domain-containing protein n=1 Tax=Pseudomonas delhiensis TaxID=366289 RepID=A0A239G2G1_9PSED|nr:AAA domain-containing protein [Pseudomonas delhiensis]SNS63447.1 AAA domain-containing protein [Pseudomonas delhiensis]